MYPICTPLFELNLQISQMKIRLTISLFWLLSLHGLQAQKVYLTVGSSINNNQISYVSSLGSTKTSSTSIAPVIGFEVQHAPKISTTWTLKPNKAFSNVFIGDLCAYTFHYNELSAKVDLGLVDYKSSQLCLIGGVSAQVLTEARQSFGSLNINLLEGGIEKAGSTLFFGMGSRGNESKLVSLVTDIRYNLGLTNFDQDMDQLLKIGSLSFNILLRLNMDALNQSKDE